MFLEDSGMFNLKELSVASEEMEEMAQQLKETELRAKGLQKAVERCMHSGWTSRGMDYMTRWESASTDSQRLQEEIE